MLGWLRRALSYQLSAVSQRRGDDPTEAPPLKIYRPPAATATVVCIRCEEAETVFESLVPQPLVAGDPSPVWICDRCLGSQRAARNREELVRAALEARVGSVLQVVGPRQGAILLTFPTEGEASRFRKYLLLAQERQRTEERCRQTLSYGPLESDKAKGEVNHESH